MTRFKQIWSSLNQFNRDVAAFQGRLWMSLVYFAVLGPIALLVRMFGNPLLPAFPTESFTHERKAPEPTIEDARRQGS